MQLLVALEPEAGADTEESDRLGRQLRQELRSLDEAEVVPVPVGAAPHGAKGIDAASATELLVTLSGSGGAVALLVATVRDWLTRRAGAHKVTVTIDGDSLELSGATPTERAELIETFVRRHQPV